MTIWQLITSDFSLEYKFWWFKLWAKIQWNEFLIGPVVQTFMAIIGDQNFWLTGSFLAALVFLADAKQKDERNVEWG